MQLNIGDRMIIDKFYTPEMSLIDLLVTKHYPKSQLRNLLKLFRTNFKGREYLNIDAKFKEVVLKEVAQATPNKPVEPYKLDLSHKSKDGEKRAQEAKQQPTVMTKDEAATWYDSMR